MCSGAFVLAATGVPKAQRAPTRWRTPRLRPDATHTPFGRRTHGDWHEVVVDVDCSNGPAHGVGSPWVGVSEWLAGARRVDRPNTPDGLGVGRHHYVFSIGCPQAAACVPVPGSSPHCIPHRGLETVHAFVEFGIAYIERRQEAQDMGARLEHDYAVSTADIAQFFRAACPFRSHLRGSPACTTRPPASLGAPRTGGIRNCGRSTTGPTDCSTTKGLPNPLRS